MIKLPSRKLLARFVGFALFIGVQWPLQVVEAKDIEREIQGVNVTEVAWMTADARRELIGQLAQSGVRAVRLGVREPFAPVLDAMELAQKNNIQVLLVLTMNNRSYFDGDTRRRHGDRIERSYPLSSLNVDRFKQVFGSFWTEMDKRNLKVLAVQVGNEINWGFNGDLQADAERTGHVYKNVEEVPDAPSFVRGMDTYVAVMRAVRELRDVSHVNSGAKILSAGLARIRPSLAASMGGDAVDPATVYRLLADRGLGRYADASAMHYYPVVSSTPVERRKILDVVLQECRAGGTQQPCWITEWGFSNTGQNCPLDDSARAALILETRENLRDAARQGSLAASFYFEWSGKSPRGIWRCGGLTEAGRAAIQPDDAPAGTPR
jgi:hypothetical protein